MGIVGDGWVRNVVEAAFFQTRRCAQFSQIQRIRSHAHEFCFAVHLPWLHSCPMVSLALGVWDGGATTGMCGFLGLETIRDSHVTSAMEDFLEIDTDPDKQISFTPFANGDSWTSNSRVTFSMPVTSKVSVGLHFRCFGQPAPTLWGLDVVRALDVIPDAVNGKVYSATASGVLAHPRTLPSGQLGTCGSHQPCACLTGGGHC